MKLSSKYLLTIVVLCAVIQLSSAETTLTLHQFDLPTTFNPSHHIAYLDDTHNLRTHDQNSFIRSSSKKSFFNDLGGAIMGFIFGPILFFIAMVFIWFNQKRAAIDYKRLKLAQSISQNVNPLRRDEISAAHMKLIHVSGVSATKQIIGDKLSNMSTTNALKINRSVEVMQWRATVNDRNGQRQVTYYLSWSTTNDINVEGRTNPSQFWFIKDQTIYNQQVFVGEYKLGKSQIDKCSKAVQMRPDMNHANNLAMNTQRSVKPQVMGEYIYFPSPNSNSISDHGALRVKYSLCPTGPISIIAKSVDNTFQPFPIALYQGDGKITKNQLPACCFISNCVATLLAPIEQLELVEEDNVDRNTMIDHAIEKSKLYSIIIRVICFIVMVLAICWFFSPITTLLGYIPLLGGILKGTAGLIIFFGAVIITIPIFIITYSLAWLFYHPKVGLIILGVGLAILGGIIALSVYKNGHPQNAAQTVNHLSRMFIP